jgi:nucleoid DNA-binding protein
MSEVTANTAAVETAETAAENAGRAAIAAKVRVALDLKSDLAAQETVKAVTNAIVAVIGENIEKDGFVLRLPKFGEFVIRHKKGAMRKIFLTGNTQQTADKRKIKFRPLSQLRSLEPVPTAKQ